MASPAPAVRPLLALPAWARVLLPLALVLVAAVLAIPLCLPEGLSGAPDAPVVPWAQAIRFLGNSAHFAGLAAVVALIPAWLIAFVALRLSGARSGRLLLILSLTPLLIPPGVFAAAAIRMGGGVLPAPGMVPFVYTLTGGALVQAWALLPYAILLLAATMARGDRSLDEAALLEAGLPAAIARVYIPASIGGLTLAFVVVFLQAATDIIVPEYLRGLPVLAREVFVQFGVYYSPTAALRLALLLFAVLVPLWLVAGRLGAGRLGQLEDERPASFGAPLAAARHPSGRLLRLAAWVVALATPLALLIPLVRGAKVPGRPLLSTLGDAFLLARAELIHSVVLGVIGAALTVLVGWPAGVLAACGRRRSISALIFVGLFLVPPAYLGIALKQWLGLDPRLIGDAMADLFRRIDFTSGPLVFSWVLRFAPLVALAVMLALRRVDLELVDATRLERRPALGHLFGWMLPSVAPTLGACAVIAFAWCFGEGSAAVMLVPPGTTTLSVRLMTLMHYAPDYQVNGICLLLMAPALLTGVAISFMGLIRRGRNSAQ